GLAAGASEDGPLPFADAVASQLARAIRQRASTTGAMDGQPDPGVQLEAFVGGLDPATGDIARELLAAAVRDSDEPSLDPAEAREVLRTCLLRLRVERLDEARRDATLLLDDAQR